MRHQFRTSSLVILGLLQILTVSLFVTSCSNVKVEARSDKETDSSNTPLPNATNAKNRFAEIDGRKIAYRSVGTGTAMILCNRFRGNLDVWDPAFLDALAKDYQVIIFDYSGFGLSTGSPATDMMGFAKDVKDLASSLGIKKFVIGGWSFGGAVAQIVTTEMPDLVSHAILIGTRPPGKFNHKPEQIFLERSSKPVNDLEDEIILFFEPTSEISKKRAEESHQRIAARTKDRDSVIAQSVWPNYVMGFADFEKDPYNARQKLSRTNIPVLVISADHEVVFPPENWFELNRKMATTQLVIIPQSGHGPHHQYPDMAADYIHAFIQHQ